MRITKSNVFKVKLLLIKTIIWYKYIKKNDLKLLWGISKKLKCHACILLFKNAEAPFYYVCLPTNIVLIQHTWIIHNFSPQWSPHFYCHTYKLLSKIFFTWINNKSIITVTSPLCAETYSKWTFYNNCH